MSGRAGGRALWYDSDMFNPRLFRPDLPTLIDRMIQVHLKMGKRPRITFSVHKRRGSGKPGEGERAPVEPSRPKPFLSGGAAAELEFGD